MKTKVHTFFGDSSNMLADQVKDLIDRGGNVTSVSIAYGPPPNRSRDTWIAIAVCDWPDEGITEVERLQVIIRQADDELMIVADEAAEETAQRIDSVRALLKDGCQP